MVHSPNGDTDFFDIVAEIMQADTLAPYMFIICLDNILRTSIDLIKENGFTLGSRWYPIETMTVANYKENLVLLTNTPA